MEAMEEMDAGIVINLPMQRMELILHHGLM